MARVNVTVNVRDLTRNELARMRHNFRSLGQDLSNAVSDRTRENFDRLSQSINVARRDITRLRGAIPNAEFRRLDDAIRQAQHTMRRGFANVGDQAFAGVNQQLREVVRAFREVDRAGEIRIRIDDTAIRRADTLLDRWRRDTERRAVRIAADVDTNRAESRLRRWAMGPLRGLGGFAGGVLSDGIGQGIMGAFRSPLFGTALVTVLLTALTAALSVVGAALAGALVFALGGAFVGLGGFIAARSKEVTRNWEAELARLKPMFQQAAEPMIPVLHRATHIMGNMGAEFAPKLEQALTRAAPMVNKFIDSTKFGFQKLGQNAWDDLQEAFRVFLVAFGPEWEDFLAELGKSLGALSRTVSEHSTEMAMALRFVLGAINLLIDAINFFANAWVMGIQFCISSSAKFIEMIGFILDSFFGMIDMMLAGLESVASVFGFEDEATRARAAFNGIRDEAVGRFAEMAASVKQLGVDIDYNNRKRKLEVDIAAWEAELERAKQQLKDVPPEKQTELRAKIDQLMGQIAAAKGQLASIQPNYYVRIHAYKTGDWAIGGGGPGQAHGGVTGNHIGRAATGGARSNMTLVGEHGPEIVNLAPGSHVRSNSDTRRIMGNAASGGGAATLVIKSGGSRMDDLLLEILRDAIHRAGGDVVTVLGGR